MVIKDTRNNFIKVGRKKYANKIIIKFQKFQQCLNFYLRAL